MDAGDQKRNSMQKDLVHSQVYNMYSIKISTIIVQGENISKICSLPLRS